MLSGLRGAPEEGGFDIAVIFCGINDGKKLPDPQLKI